MSRRASCRYAMLVCYLPPLPLHPFAIRQTPLSRLQLDRRLTLLDPEDARDLATLEEVTHWERIPPATSDRAFLAGARDALQKLDRPSLRELLGWRLELRTLVGALRRRHRGLPGPAADEAFGYGPCADSIRRYWERSDFNLSHRYPWVAVADRLLQEGNHTALEHLLFAAVWDHYTRLAWNHHFDFEAVVLYVLRWHLIDRLTRYDPPAATDRFKALLIQGLGQYDRVVDSPASAGIPITSYEA
ncbi:MAG: hypothetical protein AB1648_11330 [Pseudomonadota bacterium]